ALQVIADALVDQKYRITESTAAGFTAEFGNSFLPALFDVVSVLPGKVGKLGKYGRVSVAASPRDAGGCVVQVALVAAHIVSDAANPLLLALGTAIARFAENDVLVSASSVETPKG
ncbi:MAG: hypothetical protein KF680_10985, partial [Cryobacterium sp.]|nr:hypothetical protein [Cryobacterium sp.]